MEGSLAPLMRTLNELRRRHDGVFSLRDIRFHHSDDESFLVYTRGHADDDLLLCVVNLDPWNPRETMVRLDLGAVGLSRSEEHTSELQPLMRISYAVFCLK